LLKFSGDFKNYISFMLLTKIYFNSKWSSWSTLTKVQSGTTTFVDNTTNRDVFYKYAVKAVNGSSTGAKTTSAKNLFVYTPDLHIGNCDTGIMVNWSHEKTNDKYIIYRSEEKNGKWTSWKAVKTVKSNTEYWVDESVVPGEKYKYAVRACNGNYKSNLKSSEELVFVRTRYEF
jgi:hypothetical protein